MGLPFNIGEVTTAAICLVSRYDHSTLQTCRNTPVPTNPAEPQSSVPDSELDSGGMEEVKPWFSLIGSMQSGNETRDSKEITTIQHDRGMSGS